MSQETINSVDIFEKCFNYNLADEVKKSGLYPYFRAIEENEGPVVRMEGREVVMAGSNNYLGLTADPRVKEAGIKAIEKYGTGCSGSRYLTGTIDLHIELEKKLEKYLGFERVLLFSTGYQTGIGTISALPTKGDYVIMDKENHACLINGGMMAKGAFAELARYKHNDMADLERVLSKIPDSAGKFIVTDGVFSVSGEIVNLPELIKVAKKYNARVLVDDAHATGVIGDVGRGTASHFNLVEETDMIMGTFSKTFASLGGFVAGPDKVIDYIKHHSPALIFSASPTPSSCAATIKVLDILEQEPQRVQMLIDNANYMREGFKRIGLNIYESKTAIVPVIIGDTEKTFYMWRKLYDAGVFVNAFVPPGVPPTMAMLRTSYMATHEKQHLDKILNAFEDVAKEFQVI